MARLGIAGHEVSIGEERTNIIHRLPSVCFSEGRLSLDLKFRYAPDDSKPAIRLFPRMSMEQTIRTT
jgi:hypothetical protein